MFVLEGFETKAEIRDQQEMELILSGLDGQRYRSFLRSMVGAACKTAGLQAKAFPVRFLLDRYRITSPELLVVGEMLFLDKQILLIQSTNVRLRVWEIRPHSHASVLTQVCAELEESARKNLDGRRLRGMVFNWLPDKPQAQRRMARRYVQENKLSTKSPDYTSEELDKALLLVPPVNRDFLVKIAQLGKARTIDTSTEATKASIDELLRAGLLRREYLVLCKKDSHTICTVVDRVQIDSSSAGGFRCTICGKAFRDELIQEIFVLTDDARSLLSGSRWMSIWITAALLEAGLTLEQVLWGARAGEDEIDIICNICGFKLFLELKDREFGLGDAYPFAYRVNRYGGDSGAVITMDRVAEEARKFLAEERTEFGRLRLDTIELQGQANAEMSKLVNRVSQTAILAAVSDLSQSLGMSFVPVLQMWLSKNEQLATQPIAIPHYGGS